MSNDSESNPSPASQLQWYFDQADAGDEQAMRELGRMYLQGFTHPDDDKVEIRPDRDQALYYLEGAVAQADGNAALLLGMFYDGEATDGFENDPDEAVRRYQQAVDLGDDLARYYRKRSRPV